MALHPLNSSNLEQLALKGVNCVQKYSNITHIDNHHTGSFDRTRTPAITREKRIRNKLILMSH